MTKVDLPGLVSYRSRGKVYWYVRRKGKSDVRLRGVPGSPKFLAEYRDALGDQPSRPSAKTWRWLCMRYFASPEFGELGASTRAQRQSALEYTWREPMSAGSRSMTGDCPLSKFGRKHVRMLRDRKKDTPEAANKRIKSIRAVFKWAIKAEHFDGPNPANDLDELRPKNPDGHHTWTLAEVRQYEVRHPLGTQARLALAIFLFTGVRISDAVTLGRPNVIDGNICWTEFKGRERHPKDRAIPMLPELQAVISATPVTGTQTWLVTQYGRPFTVNGFGNKMRDWCDAAGLKHCTAHGLRKAGATIAAENGATDRQLMAIFGWETAKEVTRYTRKAQQRKLAGDAMHLVVSKE